jgi:hypothetical protein
VRDSGSLTVLGNQLDTRRLDLTLAVPASVFAQEQRGKGLGSEGGAKVKMPPPMAMMRRSACQNTQRPLGWMLASTAVLVFCTLHLSSSTAWAVGRFVFSTPPGWLNLSPDAPETDRRRAPAELLAQVSSGQFAFFAVDLETGAKLYAIVKTIKPPRMTASSLDKLEKIVERAINAQGSTYLTVKKEIVKVAGVAAALVVGDIRTPEGTSRTAQYVVPGEGAFAMITFSAPSERFESYQPVIEASIQALQGAREPTDGWWLDRETMTALVSIIAAISVIASLPLLFHPAARRLAWRILGTGLVLIVTAVLAHLVGRVVREKPGWESDPAGLGQQVVVDHGSAELGAG